MLNIPNALTSMRIVFIPVFIVCFYLPYEWAHFASACIFAGVAFTDWLDGYLARKLQQQTKFGAFLDPVADKLMVVSALTLITEHYAEPAITVAAIVMVGREILISALREWMAELGKRAHVKVSEVGKWKTMAQLMALTGLIWSEPGVIYGMALFLLYVAVILTLWSMCVYIKAAWPELMSKD
ncbi:CDP-diacylglycerol--glycerol-3-phosphate 3-phosphatidyltransferase [Catenovulum sp. SM1970]|uniref:CDP-diacylglycerol--glycerol-3-phosphate 3-phosphatidyltransferase n=1 Tax=Marinifaba aquimaris TaxID=2741323 RepID=UPI00157338FC|nr:CDP-diacylglycerol--glycerol-3-phosphate 3-phosphatidyltransferase [Marinifaba aquimaris]NTS75237.1 CDP-diacylglycerol--glycerol-3-phosphate 3-phosphatidyltransferase [Marinifaba aquimaris]